MNSLVDVIAYIADEAVSDLDILVEYEDWHQYDAAMRSLIKQLRVVVKSYSTQRQVELVQVYPEKQS